jgi:alkylation response protein AidB-like acyl-CoA dehydrogenase
MEAKSRASSSSAWLERAREVIPVLKRNASACEENRKLMDENVSLLEERGLFGVIVPTRLGGGGASMETLQSVSIELGRACASTSWVHMIYAIGGWNGSNAAPVIQQDVFAKRVPRICGVGSPTGKARAVDGGYLVTGRWSYATGVHHAEWLFLSVTREDGAPSGSVIVPAAQLAIEANWHVAGMRGTGSDAVIASDVFVPAHRFEEGTSVLQLAAVPYAREPSDYWPFWPTMVVPALGPPIGIALGIHDLVRAGIMGGSITNSHYASYKTSEIVQRDLAEASLQIDAARIVALELAREVDRLGEARQDPLTVSSSQRARIRGFAGHVARLLGSATQTLVSLAGAGCFFDTNPIQRAWRDLNVVLRHSFLLPNPAFEIYGKDLLGIDPNLTDTY